MIEVCGQLWSVGEGGESLTRSVDPVSRMTINVWPPILDVWSTLGPHRANMHCTALYRSEVRATLQIVLSSRIPVDTLRDAQVIMIGNCEFPREHIVSDSYRWGVEANAR